MGSSYRIIDEPTASGKERLILNPLIILFAAIFIPLFINLPALGKFWMPLVWVMVNSYFLGSASWKKELHACLIGAAGLLIVFFLHTTMTLAELIGLSPDFLVPYVRILLNAILFMTLYYAVFTQSTSFELHKYINNREG